MSEQQKNDNINVVNPKGKTYKTDYDQSDVERIYKDANAKNWQDLLKFIQQRGDAEWHITPGEAFAMLEDFKKLAEKKIPFIEDPAKAYEEAHKFRAEAKAREEGGMKGAQAGGGEGEKKRAEGGDGGRKGTEGGERR